VPSRRAEWAWTRAIVSGVGILQCAVCGSDQAMTGRVPCAQDSTARILSLVSSGMSPWVYTVRFANT
jgi:hypothetical protein